VERQHAARLHTRLTRSPRVIGAGVTATLKTA
jgi:hypothetical protein